MKSGMHDILVSLSWPSLLQQELELRVMAWLKSVVRIVVLATLFSACLSSATYKAAVVEFYPDQFHSPNVRIQNNLKGFELALDALRRAGGANIVVFPEDAILGEAYFSREQIAPYLEAIPEVTPTSHINPCTDSATFKDRPILQKLSCLAKQYGIVLVANMGDVQPCTSESCPKDQKHYFNTNVVFETDGTLVAKYHKVNLYAEEAKIFNPGVYSNTTCVSFDTSFGVAFGTFTCYDLLFHEPANCLLSKGIQNFVLPTAWGSSYPFYMSVAVQQGWSRKHGVNFLAANQHFKITYSTGSGIYTNGVARHYMISGDTWPTATGQVLIADLPEDPHGQLANTTQIGNRSSVASIPAKTNTYLNFTLLQKEEGVTKVEYYNDKSNLYLGCRLEHSVLSMPEKEQYAVGAYVGTSVDDSEFQFAVCTLVKCSLSGRCGEPEDGYEVKTVFDKLILSGTFPEGSDVYATGLGSQLDLLNPSLVSLGTDSMSITGNNLPLLAASLWTRVYSN